MEEYDKFEKFQEFQSTEHVCGVCFEQVQGKFMCQPCAKCGLLYCKTCLHDYCKVQSSSLERERERERERESQVLVLLNSS